MNYQPRKSTLEMLDRLSDEIGRQPMRFIAELAQAGFTGEAIAEKLEIPATTVRKLMRGKGIKPGSTVLAGRGTKGGPRPWKNNHAERVALITQARRAKAKKYDGRCVSEWVEFHGLKVTPATQNRARRQLELGVPGEALVMTANTGGRDARGRFAIRRKPVADERQAG